jgi:molybdopterin-guanine dinucleotide biosynthesis protein A
MGTDKALLPFGKTTLLAHAVAQVQPLCTEVLVSSDNPLHEGCGYRRVPDLWPEQGPLSGCISCLYEVHTPQVLLVSVDMPLADTSVYRRLIDSYQGMRAWKTPQRQYPLPAVIQANIRPILETAFESGERRLYTALHNAGIHFFKASGDIIPLLVNCNTPDALQEAMDFANKQP